MGWDIRGLLNPVGWILFAGLAVTAKVAAFAVGLCFSVPPDKDPPHGQEKTG